jgi:hypothetical protein
MPLSAPYIRIGSRLCVEGTGRLTPPANGSWRRQTAAVCLASHQAPADRGIPGQKERLLAQYSRRVLIGSTGLGVFCSCGLCGQQTACAEENLSAQELYGEVAGPSSWGGSCSSGMQQSPVDIPKETLRSNISSAGPLVPLKFGYRASRARVCHSGSTIQVSACTGPEGWRDLKAGWACWVWGRCCCMAALALVASSRRGCQNHPGNHFTCI